MNLSKIIGECEKDGKLTHRCEMNVNDNSYLEKYKCFDVRDCLYQHKKNNIRYCLYHMTEDFYKYGAVTNKLEKRS